MYWNSEAIYQFVTYIVHGNSLQGSQISRVDWLGSIMHQIKGHGPFYEFKTRTGVWCCGGVCRVLGGGGVERCIEQSNKMHTQN